MSWVCKILGHHWVPTPVQTQGFIRHKPMVCERCDALYHETHATARTKMDKEIKP
jgi:hypothetical protein